MAVGFAEPCHRTRQQRTNARIIHQIRPKHYVEKGVFTLTVTFRSFLATVGTTIAVALAAVAVARLLLVAASRPRVTIGPIQPLDAGVVGHIWRQKGDVVLRVGDQKRMQINQKEPNSRFNASGTEGSWQ